MSTNVSHDFDFVIIGAGAAGFSAALKANELGVRTLIINKGPIGGTCVNVGCVPTKYLLSALELRVRALKHHYAGMKFEEVDFDFSKLIKGKDQLVSTLRKEKYENVIKSMENVTYLNGEVKFLSNNKILVNGKTIAFKKALIATGSRTKILNIKGINNVRDRILTNVEALSLRKLPGSVIILGGRAQALEFSQIFKRAGSKVTILQRSPSLIPTMEPEISFAIEDHLKEEGIDIFTMVTVHKIERTSDGVRVIAKVFKEERIFEADYLFFGTGRIPNTENLNLKNASIKTDERGFIAVDDFLRTSSPNIFAAGDVIGEPMLETVAAKEGYIAATNALSNESIKIDYSIIPKVIFTDPQIASVGLTDRQANKVINCSCRTVDMSQVPKARILGENKGLVKMVVERDTNRILGIHIIAHNAAEMIHEGVMIIKNKMTIDDVIDTLHVFPTLSEAIKLVALSYKMDINTTPCCVI